MPVPHHASTQVEEDDTEGVGVWALTAALMCSFGGPLVVAYWAEHAIEENPFAAAALLVAALELLAESLGRTFSPRAGKSGGWRPLLGYAIAAAVLALNVATVASWSELPAAQRSPLRVVGLVTGTALCLMVLLDALQSHAASAEGQRPSFGIGPGREAQFLVLEVSFLIAALASASSARLEALMAWVLFGCTGLVTVGIVVRQASAWSMERRALRGGPARLAQSRLPALARIGWALGVGGGLHHLLRRFGAPPSWLALAPGAR